MPDPGCCIWACHGISLFTRLQKARRSLPTQDARLNRLVNVSTRRRRKKKKKHSNMFSKNYLDFGRMSSRGKPNRNLENQPGLFRTMKKRQGADQKVYVQGPVQVEEIKWLLLVCIWAIFELSLNWMGKRLLFVCWQAQTPSEKKLLLLINPVSVQRTVL